MFGFGKQDVDRERILDRIAATVREVINGAASETADKLREVSKLSGTVDALKKQVTDLEIQRDKKQEEYARREREVEHMVGLERKRAEFERESAAREATLRVREENLKADRDRFEAQMEFQNTRFTAEVGYLKEMIGRVLEAIPNVAPVTKARK